MIPYIEIAPLHLFGLTFHAFGALVALGFIVGTKLAALRARQTNLHPAHVHDVAFLCIVCGLIGAHFVHVVAYEPHTLWREPWVLLKVWSGISSYGGFIGATAGVLYLLRKRNLPILPYCDALVFGLMGGWIFGRIGCSLAHDHPGRLSDFVLAVQYPGGARHDLGFYELLVSIGIFSILVLITQVVKWRLKPGSLLVIVLLLYNPIRFALDFLRAQDLPHADTRYLGLTPAQYFSIVLFFMGVYLWCRYVAKVGKCS